MAVGKKYFNSEALMQLAVLLSVTRPDLQQYLQNPTEPLQEVPGCYNWTGPYGTTYGITSPIDYMNINPKDNTAAFDQNPNYLTDLLKWHDYGGRHEDFINMHGGIASQNEVHIDTESGYSSDHSSLLSPAPSSTASASPIRDEFQGNAHGSQTDLSQFGASGFTPATEDPELYKLLMDSFEEDFDFGNLPPSDQFPVAPALPIKSEPLSPLSDQGFGSSCPLTKGVDLDSKAGCLEDNSFYHDPNHKSALEQIGLQNNFQEELPYDPYSIDWASPAPSTNSTVLNPDLTFSNEFDLDPLASTWADDFILPLDILRPIEQSQLEESRAVPQNDSGVPLSGSAILSTFNTPKSRDLVPPATVNVKSEDLSTVTRAALVTRKIAAPTKTISAVKKVNGGAKSNAIVERPSKLEYSDARIIDMPVDEFNVFVEELSEDEAKYARDLRRRGKNKEAARTCRKRKLEVIDGLEEEVLEMRAQKQKILDEREKLKAENIALKDRVTELQTDVLKSLRDDQGQPLSSKDYSLFQGEDGNVFVAKNLNR